jgi:formylglycine-generating enzyme required for sulfatase activity/dienelactone hydrolase
MERPPSERAAFLALACANDPDLRREVESLLAHAGQADALLESPAWKPLGTGEDTTSVLPAMAAGSEVGGFRILELIGAGGMGEVYRATDTKLNREVAIKILSDSFAQDADRLARFTREAQVLASLNHPNIAAIYGVEARALVLELVEGQTLAERIAKGPLPLDDALPIACQIAESLKYAHEKGIIHRDLKPANVKVTPEGRVKVLDFGLAKVRAEQIDAAAATDTLTVRTEPGMVMGTVGYMSPEQVRGLPVNHRTDIFSFGVVLYEMVTGERPFAGSSTMAVWDAILHAQPRDFGDSLAPGKLKSIIRKLLEKDPANRYGSADEVHQELKALETSLAPARPVRLSRNAWIAVGAAVVLVGVLAGWLWRGSSRQRWALETAAPEITRLVDAGEYVKAAALTREARSLLPKDPTLEKLWMRATGEVSIGSVPVGADVSIRLYRGDPNAWEFLGKTPLRNIRIPRGAYIWRVAKPGFTTAYMIGQPPGAPAFGYRSRFDLTWNLRPEGSVPPEMVVVAGGRVGLAYPLNQAPRVEIDDFLIDRHEVTNEEYKRFVEAGGYQKGDFWKQPFVRDGRTIPWEEAVALFHDATGRPGPATWEVGDYPKGREKYPVAGVSWYEAAAYAEFAGKSLPTAYHWTRASQGTQGAQANGLVAQWTGFTSMIASGSNFQREGTRPVGSPGALSGFGTTDMAGNVKEWCWNEGRDTRRLILGGGFGDPDYMFDHADIQSPWDRRANFGFRCVKLDAPPTPAAAAHIEVTTRDYWNEKPVPDNVSKVYTALYAYDKGDLNAEEEETATTQGWTREKVTFDAAYGYERVTAYLFLPRNASPPFQTVVFFPGAGAFFDNKIDLSSVEDQFDFVLRSGRALIVPTYKGSYERRDDYRTGGGQPQAVFREHVIAWSKDVSRSLDYLETRKEIDGTKVAFFGASLGGAEAPIVAAVETRIKAVIISSGGFQLRRDLPEVDPLNFASHVTTPVLMLSGRYDATFPLQSSQDPLFQILGTPDSNKKHVIYEGGHGVFPRPDAVRECLDWLDKYLGPVRH